MERLNDMEAQIIYPGSQSLSQTQHSGHPQQDSRHLSNWNTNQLLAFKKCLKREVSQYTTLKDEKYFEAIKRNFLVTATTHGCEEVVEPGYLPRCDDDSQELFQQKQYSMYSVFIEDTIQSDMGKPIVRKYALTLDAQAVWKEFETHMSTSSKGLNDRLRLHAFSTTVYDRSWKGISEQFASISMSNLGNSMNSLNRENGSSHQRHNRQHNDAKIASLGSLLGLPVKSNGMLFRQNTKQQSNLHTQMTYSYPNWLFGYPAQETEPNSSQQLWYVGIQQRILFGLI